MLLLQKSNALARRIWSTGCMRPFAKRATRVQQTTLTRLYSFTEDQSVATEKKSGAAAHAEERLPEAHMEDADSLLIPMDEEKKVEVDEEWTGMRLVFLGTGSNKPTKHRNVSSIALQLEGEAWLFDCGEGTQHQIMRSNTLGLLGVVLDSYMTNREIMVYGPLGVRQFILNQLQLIQAKKWQVRIVELMHPKQMNLNLDRRAILCPDMEGVYHLFESDRFIVKAKTIQHTVPCYGYVIEEKPKQGKLLVEKLQEDGLPPGSHYKLIKQGRNVPFNDRLFRAQDYLLPQVPGRKVVILGDTNNPYNLLPIATNPDVVVHESTLPDQFRAVAYSRGHSSPTMAGEFARAINAKNLIMTHFGGQFTNAFEYINSVMVPQAVKAFGSNSVIAARDFATFNVWRADQTPPETPQSVQQNTAPPESLQPLQQTAQQVEPNGEPLTQSTPNAVVAQQIESQETIGNNSN